MSAQVADLLAAWLVHVEKLLFILGWWIILGLCLCAVIHWLVPPSFWQRPSSVWVAAAVGALLPLCNYGVAPLAVSLSRRGASADTALTFFAAGTFLSPGALLTAYALLGPMLSGAYLAAALACVTLVGLVSRYLCAQPRQTVAQRLRLTESVRWSLLDLGPELALWYLLGILLEAAVLTLLPADLFQGLLRNPAAAPLSQLAALGLARYLCVPDDISLAASLSAAGASPAGTLLFLLVGLLTNLPELAVLWKLVGKRACACFFAIGLLCGIVTAGVVQLLSYRFLPQFDLTAAAGFLDMAGHLTIGTWASARRPCVVLLVLLGLVGVWRYVRGSLKNREL